MILIHDAYDLYDRVYRRGWWSNLWAALRRQPARLLDLEELARHWKVRSRHFVGRQSVPIHQIRGSEGRVDDFDSRFHPVQHTTEDRWSAMALARLTGIDFPPVELIRVGDTYCVRDGHHRISVAAALGQHEIDALVTVWEVNECPASTSPSMRFLSSQR